MEWYTYVRILRRRFLSMPFRISPAACPDAGSLRRSLPRPEGESSPTVNVLWCQPKSSSGICS